MLEQLKFRVPTIEGDFFWYFFLSSLKPAIDYDVVISHGHVVAQILLPSHFFFLQVCSVDVRELNASGALDLLQISRLHTEMNDSPTDLHCLTYSLYKVNLVPDQHQSSKLAAIVLKTESAVLELD